MKKLMALYVRESYIRDHSFSTYAECSEKLSFLTFLICVNFYLRTKLMIVRMWQMNDP